MADVRALVRNLIELGPDDLGVAQRVAGINLVVNYGFRNGQLAQVGMYPLDEDAEAPNAEKNFRMLKDLLVVKYGQPWMDEASPSSEGTTFITGWHSGKTTIMLTRDTARPRPSVTILYNPTAELRRQIRMDADKL